MKRERNTESEGELKNMEDERGRGRVGERESLRERERILKPKTKRNWMKERARSNIDSKEL
jgi:hypothetical protein